MTHAALQFKCGLGGGGGRQGGKALEAGGMLGDRGSQQLVGALRQGHALRRFEVVQAGCRHGEDLHIDAAFVHERQPHFPEIIEPLFDLTPVERCGTFCSDGGGGPGCADASGQKMFLDADQLCHCHQRFLDTSESKRNKGRCQSHGFRNGGLAERVLS